VLSSSVQVVYCRGVQRPSFEEKPPTVVSPVAYRRHRAEVQAGAVALRQFARREVVLWVKANAPRMAVVVAGSAGRW